MSGKKHIDKKLRGHAKSVTEHVGKYDKYPHKQDKKFALKTLGNTGKQMGSLFEKRGGSKGFKLW